MTLRVSRSGSGSVGKKIRRSCIEQKAENHNERDLDPIGEFAKTLSKASESDSILAIIPMSAIISEKRTDLLLVLGTQFLVDSK